MTNRFKKLGLEGFLAVTTALASLASNGVTLGEDYNPGPAPVTNTLNSESKDNNSKYDNLTILEDGRQILPLPAGSYESWKLNDSGKWEYLGLMQPNKDVMFIEKNKASVPQVKRHFVYPSGQNAFELPQGCYEQWNVNVDGTWSYSGIMNPQKRVCFVEKQVKTEPLYNIKKQHEKVDDSGWKHVPEKGSVELIEPLYRTDKNGNVRAPNIIERKLNPNYHDNKNKDNPIIEPKKQSYSTGTLFRYPDGSMEDYGPLQPGQNLEDLKRKGPRETFVPKDHENNPYIIKNGSRNPDDWTILPPSPK